MAVLPCVQCASGACRVGAPVVPVSGVLCGCEASLVWGVGTATLLPCGRVPGRYRPGNSNRKARAHETTFLGAGARHVIAKLQPGAVIETAI